MCRARLALLLCLASLLPASAQQPTPPQRPVIGLALEGGGALGIAHIGVLQWMEEHHVPVDRLSGTSMGSLIGGLYAAGYGVPELRQIARGSEIATIFTMEAPYTSVSFRRREDRREGPGLIAIGLKNNYGPRNSLLTDGGLNQFLNREFFSYNNAELDFDTLPIPFRCVATDLTTLAPLVFRSGPLPQAVRASVSIPGVFPPVKVANGHFLADGGIVDNLPTGILRSDLHADVVIAVHLESGRMATTDIGSIFNVLNRAFSAGVALNEAQSKKLADVLVSVPLNDFSTSDYSKTEGLIKAGYEAAEASRAALLRYSLSAADWQTYLAARDARRHSPPGAVRVLRVAADNSGAKAQVERDLHTIEGRPLTPDAMRRGLRDVQANGEYSANYETFAVTPYSPQDTGVLVSVQRNPGGPPFLLAGPEITASTSNVTRGMLDMRFIYQGLGGYGSELRSTVRIGYLTDLGVEYYRQLTLSGFFVQPQVHGLRQPVYIWANQKRISERFQENLDIGLQAGKTISNSLQVAAQWQFINTRWSLRTGFDDSPYLSGKAQTGLLRVNLDKSTSSTISPDSTRLSLAVGSFYHAVGSDNAPLVQGSFFHTRHLSAENMLGLGISVNSYMRARVAEPFRFTLGGPLSLSASSLDEYRGTDTLLARAGELHRIAALPTGLGQGLYSLVGYEVGEIWSPDRTVILRQNGTAGLVAATPFGTLTFGVAIGDAGHRKVFFTIGRWF